MRREWELEDLIECWTLDERDVRLLASKSGVTRLGFALAGVSVTNVSSAPVGAGCRDFRPFWSGAGAHVLLACG